ncbi:MAG: hypothetical protein ABSH06_15015 [Thermodesulfobacteriota bacterium]
MINEIFDKMVYYLPVFVPFSLTVFSVVTRLISGTMELKLRNFLKTYTDIVLGIFSFLVWGLITLLQTGKIKINEDLSIPPAKLLILLILDIILLIVAAVISRHQWSDSSNEIPLTKTQIERFFSKILRKTYLQGDRNSL